MFYKSLILSLFSLCFLSAQTEATSDEMLASIAKSSGVVLTPNKTAIQRMRSGGLGVLAVVKEEQAAAERLKQQQEVEKREKLAQLQEQAKEEQRQREKAELLEKMKREEGEKLAKERAEHDRLLEILEREQQEKLERERIEYVRQLEILKLEYDKQFEQERAESRRQIAEAQQALGAQREGRVVGDVEELQARFEQMQEERDSLLSKLMTITAGQADLPPEKSEFIAYGSSYIHLNNLREPDTTLDAQLQQNLKAIYDNVEILIEKSDLMGLKGVQKMMIKRQLGRLKDGIENFETAGYLRTFSETRNHLSAMAHEVTFKEIEESVQWLEENRSRLSRVGEHQAYTKRQREVEILVQQKRADFESFYEDYMDRFVAGMCVWLAPTQDDGGAVKEGKLEFMFNLLTNSIPLLKNYLNGPMPVFGTRDTFLSQTFMRCLRGKEYGVFKETLQSYSTIFAGLGEHQKLVEEVLNYEFFQKRYNRCVTEIQHENPAEITEESIRTIIETMMNEDVLKYKATNTALFAASIPAALKDSIAKAAVGLEQISLWGKVKKLLIAYSQIHAFSNNLRAGNPKIIDFHDQQG